MNNFNDYYNYLNNNLGKDNNFMPYKNQNKLLNEMKNFDDSTFSNTFINLSDTLKLYSPSEGFMKGNMYANLYDPYKNYKPMTLKPRSERESMLMQIQMCRFAMNDLVLYLDVNPRNSNLIKLYNDYLKKVNELTNNYERMYGPLTNDGMTMPTNDWTWKNSPWPWEVEQ